MIATTSMMRKGVGVSAVTEFPSKAVCRRTALAIADEPSVREIFRPCDPNQLIERVPFVRMRPTAAENDIGEFVEAKHPKRQLEGVRINNLRQSGKMGRVFVVRIKDDDAQLWPHRDRLPQEEAHSCRLADSCRPQHREMSSDQFADVDLRRDDVVLAQLPDFDPLSSAETVDGSKIVGAYPVRCCAE